MIIHSIAPLSMLLPPDEAPPPETLPVGNALLVGRNTDRGFEVSSVVSTDPKAYLDGSLSPGTVFTGDGKAAPQQTWVRF